MNHKELWTAIEEFACANKMSCSGLARKSGLDATTFNRSKRFSSYGQERWPSMYSISKMLRATNSSLADFIKFLPDSNPGSSEND